MPQDGIECKSFTVVYNYYLLVYENRFYLQVYLDNYGYKTAKEQMTDYPDENYFED